MSWLYRPEDLPGGRQRSHRIDELLVSNHLDVIDSQTVNGNFELIQWNDNFNDVAVEEVRAIGVVRREAMTDITQDQHFWRHAYDPHHSRICHPF